MTAPNPVDLVADREWCAEVRRFDPTAGDRSCLYVAENAINVLEYLRERALDCHSKHRREVFVPIDVLAAEIIRLTGGES